MDDLQQIGHFTTDLHNLVERYYAEYDLSYAAMIGVLELQKAIIIEDCIGISFEVEDPDPDDEDIPD